MNRTFLRKLFFSGQRFTQNSPILPDVWMQLATSYERLPVLLTPNKGVTPGELAGVLRKRLAEWSKGKELSMEDKGPRVAHNQTVVVADMSFEEMIQVVMPMSVWWKENLDADPALTSVRESQRSPITEKATKKTKKTKKKKKTTKEKDAEAARKKRVKTIQSKLRKAMFQENYIPKNRDDLKVDVVWLCRIVGTIALLKESSGQVEVADGELTKIQVEVADGELTKKDSTETKASSIQAERNQKYRERYAIAELVAAKVGELLEGVIWTQPENQGKPTLWCVNRNRTTDGSLFASGPAVKSDATQRLFKVSGRRITLAVIDSGIDARHRAFRQRDEKTNKLRDVPFEKQSDEIDGDIWINHTRVKHTFDLTNLRDILAAEKQSELTEEVQRQLKKRKVGDIDEMLKKMRSGKVIDWELLRPWIEIPHEGSTTDEQKPARRTKKTRAKKTQEKRSVYQPPSYPHGTHVAGIIGADWEPDETEREGVQEGYIPEGRLTGVAPSVQFIDVRVLSEDGTGDEFSMMAGLQFVRHLNMIHERREVHAVNLSFSLHHDFIAFACGQTPICQEAERLTGEGTIVVAAAGNEGMTQYKTVDDETGSEQETTGYRSMGITDPGNADNVITVGATHRRDPHTYGVSYFSSRGPTGDGRRKPDIVAPGEKIMSTFPNNLFGEMDGTSQAAPHVSGAVALLLERNSEMIGRPDRVKRILCDTATDLGRDHYFQGAGMIDILRALQSI